MSHKSQKIAELIRSVQNQALDAHYLGYFECFNRQLFFEAHEVLEELWLAQRGQANDLFYKGLIQLAGAFVHLQKQRRRPAIALFGLAQANLRRYPSVYESLDLSQILALISSWLERLETEDDAALSIQKGNWPMLSLRRTGLNQNT